MSRFRQMSSPPPAQT